MRGLAAMGILFLSFAGCIGEPSEGPRNEFDSPSGDSFVEIDETHDLDSGASLHWDFVLSNKEATGTAVIYLQVPNDAPASQDASYCLTYSLPNKGTTSIGSCEGNSGNVAVSPPVRSGRMLLYEDHGPFEEGSYAFSFEAGPQLNDLRATFEIGTKAR